jgi:hypothetical protein
MIHAATAGPRSFRLFGVSGPADIRNTSRRSAPRRHVRPVWRT